MAITNQTVEQALQQASDLQNQEELQQAIDILNGLINAVKDLPHEDEGAEYLSFRSPMERGLYFWHFHPVKEGVQTELPLSRIYYQLGSVLISANEPMAAREQLAKALLWNPIDFYANMEYAMTFQMQGEMEDFLYLVQRASKYAYTGESHARILRNYGYYFIEHEDYDAAEVCYLMSRIWDPDSHMAEHQLVYISQQSGKAIGKLSDERIGQVMDRFGFSLYPNKAVVNLARQFGKAAYDEQDWDPARYYLGIVYDLTDDKDAAELLAQIPEGGANHD